MLMEKTNLKEFSKSKTDLAGAILSDKTSTKEEKENALKILSNWRAAHSYPVHIFKKRLKNVSKELPVPLNAFSVYQKFSAFS